MESTVSEGLGDIRELRERYAELFAETTQARNRTWLIRRIIWRMQSLAGGGLSEQARQRAEELANTSDLRVTAPRAPTEMASIICASSLSLATSISTSSGTPRITVV